MPNIYQSDEDLNLVLIQNMLRNGDPNPHFFRYPLLLFILNGVVYFFYFLVGKLAGQFNSLTDVPSPIMAAMGSGKIVLPNIMLVSRMLSAIFGIGSVLLLYICGRKLTGNIVVGIVAGVILTVSPTHITSSQKIAPDALVVFFCSSSLLWRCRHICRRKARL
ncbi:MAG TPA: phospholipid carrier-dependent glycosyltransferase [Patescibacteria group bacterium]|nr:phospholipid carrier-dependent glycosyltransferase [Patescibacteria group bacterium]